MGLLEAWLGRKAKLLMRRESSVSSNPPSRSLQLQRTRCLGALRLCSRVGNKIWFCLPWCFLSEWKWATNARTLSELRGNGPLARSRLRGRGSYGISFGVWYFRTTGSSAESVAYSVWVSVVFTRKATFSRVTKSGRLVFSRSAAVRTHESSPRRSAQRADDVKWLRGVLVAIQRNGAKTDIVRL